MDSLPRRDVCLDTIIKPNRQEVGNIYIKLHKLKAMYILDVYVLFVSTVEPEAQIF